MYRVLDAGPNIEDNPLGNFSPTHALPYGMQEQLLPLPLRFKKTEINCTISVKLARSLTS